MGFFDFIGEGAQWIGDRISDADDWVNDRLKDAGNWFSDFYHGNLGDQAVPAPVIVQQVQQGPGTSSWDSGSATVQKMIQEHNQNSDDAQQITTMLESVWTGDGADAARARLRPLSDASSTSAQAYVVNGQKLVDTTHGYNDMKIALQAMPPTPPHKNLWDQGTPWDTDTEKQINAYNAAANHNVERYQKYADQAKTNGQGLNSNYGQVAGFDGQNLKIDSGGDHVTGKTGSHERSYRRSDSGGPGSEPGTGLGSGSGTVGGPGTGGVGASGVNGPGTVGGSGWGSGSAGGVTAPPPSPPPGDYDGTSTSGWTPPSVDRVGVSPWTPPMSTPTPTSLGTGGGSDSSGWTPGAFGPLGGASEAGAGGRSGGIAARLGGGAGAGAGAGARTGAGAGVGAGEEGAGRGAAGAAGKGAAGAKGSPGMGGMAGGGKGKGEEDKEHQRKYGIDDDSAFSLVDENGERALDPRTGLPPTPPTIGG